MAEVKFFWNFLCLKKLVSSCPVLCISIVLSGSYSSGCWGRQQAKSCTKILMAFIIRFIHPVRVLMSWTAAGSANNINPVQEYPCIRCIHWLDFSLGLSGPTHPWEKRIRSALRIGVMKPRLARQNRSSPFHTALCNLRDSQMTNQHLSFSSSIQSTFPFNLTQSGRESALQLGSVP